MSKTAVCVKLEISCIQITAIELLCAVLVVYCAVRGFQTFVAADHSIYYLRVYENDSLKLRCVSARSFNAQTEGWAEAVKEHLTGSLSNED